MSFLFGSRSFRSRSNFVTSMWFLLEYSRRFHIYDSCTTRKVWIRIGFVWKVFESMEVEAMSCKDEWLDAAEMFCEDS